MQFTGSQHVASVATEMNGKYNMLTAIGNDTYGLMARQMRGGHIGHIDLIYRKVYFQLLISVVGCSVNIFVSKPSVFNYNSRNE